MRRNAILRPVQAPIALRNVFTHPQPKAVISSQPPEIKRRQGLNLWYVRIECREAEDAHASATSSSDLSSELKLNEIKFCLDCIKRERLNFSVSVCSCVELFRVSHADNYPVQMQLSGL